MEVCTSPANIRETDREMPARAQQWHIITSEYPPQAGGVADYTYWVASGLAAQGDEVHVWGPACPGTARSSDGVVYHDVGGFTAASLRHVNTQLNRFPAPRRVLVQWVPHGYGWRSMNLAFCFWLWNRSVRYGDRVEIMLHEPFLGFGDGSWRQNFPAVVHRLMTIVLLRATEQVWMSIPSWETCWRPYALGRKISFDWLPIPSNIPVINNRAAVHAIRQRYAPSAPLIGHFGTYGSTITSLLEPMLLSLSNDDDRQVILLMGIGSKDFRDRLIAKHPQLGSCIQSTGSLSPEDLSCHVSACDLLIQPYPDGVSSRRTSFMVGLCHGKPIVTNAGRLTESFWADTGAAALAVSGDVDAFVNLTRSLRDDEPERNRLGAAAKQVYQDRFDIRHVLQALRSAGNVQ